MRRKRKSPLFWLRKNGAFPTTALFPRGIITVQHGRRNSGASHEMFDLKLAALFAGVGKTVTEN